MNAVIYARFSSHQQNEQSIEGQLKVCYDYAQRNGYIIVGEYIDRALTGTSDKRPQFQKMINDSAKRQFEAIIVYQLDRFARNRYDSATYKAKLKKNGVRVVSARENIADDASGALMEAVLEGMAEYYSKELSQKVTRGMNINAEKCQYNGGVIPLGYYIDNDKKYQIDKDTAPIVTKIFEMYAGGSTVKQISDELNEKHIKTSRGAEFNKNSLHTMLANKKYLGIYTYNDIEIPNGMPRIISDELFDKVQEILAKNKKAPARAKATVEYILTTKLFCGHCRAMMTGVSGTSRTGTVFYYYTCNNYKKNVQKDYIENLILKMARAELTNENIEKISHEIEAFCEKEKDKSNLKRLNKELAEINKAIENLLKAIEEGKHINLLSDRITKKESEKAEIEKLIVLEKLQYVDLTASEIKFFLTRLKTGDINDMKYRKMLITVLVHSVYLYDDGSLMITFNAGDRPITISAGQIADFEKEFATSGSFLNDVGSSTKFFHIVPKPPILRQVWEFDFYGEIDVGLCLVFILCFCASEV